MSHPQPLPETEADFVLAELSSRLRGLSCQITDVDGLADLSGILDTPTLQELIIFDMNHLTPGHVQMLKRSKSIKALRTDNLKIEKALGWPRTGTASVFKLSASPESRP
jgi:hypothetical protein